MGGLDPDVESYHIIFSQNTYINFKSLLIIYFETFKVINLVKFSQMFQMTQHLPELNWTSWQTWSILVTAHSLIRRRAMLLALFFGSFNAMEDILCNLIFIHMVWKYIAK